MATSEASLAASNWIRARVPALAEAAATRYFRQYPQALAQWGDEGRRRTVEDYGFHLQYLAEALWAGQPSLFIGYIGWAKVLLERIQIPGHVLADALECLSQVLAEELPPDLGLSPLDFLRRAVSRLPQLPADLPTTLEPPAPYAALCGEYLECLLRGARASARRLILDEVDRGGDLQAIYLHVFQQSQLEIGRLWQTNRINVAQEHYCTACTQQIMAELYPRIFGGPRNGLRLVAACVGGDLHEIGLRMVADFFELHGWDTYFLGANTPSRSIVRMLADMRADVLAVSVTMAYHLRQAADLVSLVRSAPGCGAVRILVGGYPFNAVPDLWRRLGADAFARDAAEAVAVATALAQRRP